MPQAMPGSNAHWMPGAKHATYVRNERNVRHQDSGENSSVSYPPKPVDNRKTIPSSHAFATFIDDTLRSYAKSAQYRSALHAEQPGALPGEHGICPPQHKHAVTSTCYQRHKCRCEACRAGWSRVQKQGRTRRAVAGWARADGTRRTA